MSVPAVVMRLVILLAAVAGCGSDRESPAPTPTPAPTSASASPTATPITELTGLDWTSAKRNTLVGTWSAGPCPGGGRAPLRCVFRNNKVSAQLELLSYPVPSLGRVGRAIKAGRPLEGLRALAEQSFTTFRQDRAATCTGEVSFDSVTADSRTVLRRLGVRYQFALRRDHKIDEVVTGWATVRRNTVELIVSAGYARNACLPPDGTSISPSALASAAQILDAAVAGGKAT